MAEVTNAAAAISWQFEDASKVVKYKQLQQQQVQVQTLSDEMINLRLTPRQSNEEVIYSSSGTVTVSKVISSDLQQQQQQQQESLPDEMINLRLTPRRKKEVSWASDTVDNERINLRLTRRSKKQTRWDAATVAKELSTSLSNSGLSHSRSTTKKEVRWAIGTLDNELTCQNPNSLRLSSEQKRKNFPKEMYFRRVVEVDALTYLGVTPKSTQVRVVKRYSTKYQPPVY
ncbi:unnamed protein product [Calypogeia fissa]